MLSPMISLHGAWTRFEGLPGDETDQAVSHSDFSGGSLAALGGLSLRWMLGDAFLAMQSQLGAPFVAVVVTDGSETIGGVQGLEWSNSLSLGWAWFD